MTRRILATLTAISIVLLAFASPHSAKEHQVDTGASVGDRSQQNRQAMNAADAEKLRSHLITAFEESEALIRFLAGYDFILKSQGMKDYEAACRDLAKQRVRVEQMSVAEVMAQANILPDINSLNRVIEVSHSVRNDQALQAVFQRAERYYQAGLMNRNSSSVKESNSRGVIAAPAYIAPTCDYDDPSNYPSGTDLAIANGVALALHTAADAVPEEFVIFGVGIPNPIHIALVIAAGVADIVATSLSAVAADGVYCESIRLLIEVKLINDSGLTSILVTDNFYLTFMLKSVRASLAKATSTGVPINCGQTRLTEANAFFTNDVFSGANGTMRVEAYKKLRAAYQNIGASSCIQ